MGIIFKIIDKGASALLVMVILAVMLLGVTCAIYGEKEGVPAAVKVTYETGRAAGAALKLVPVFFQGIPKGAEEIDNAVNGSKSANKSKND